MRFQFPEAVVVDGPDAVAGLNPVATVEDGETIVQWFEGNHARAFVVDRVLEDTVERLRFRDNRGRVYSLEPMTLARYREKVQSHTVGRPSFRTLAELLDAMRAEW
jgi:hypothetical protein